jgi:amidase
MAGNNFDESIQVATRLACAYRDLDLFLNEQSMLADHFKEALETLNSSLPTLESNASFGHKGHAFGTSTGWAEKSERTHSSSGPLAGLTFAAKDNMLVEGIALRLGSDRRDPLIPKATAPVVQACLSNGAILKGKAQCEDFCQGSQSFTSHPSPVENPVVAGRSSGGSSSGSAALVAAGEVDFALGTDSGGSVRLPASYCGLVGMKPTAGLLSFSGIFPLASSLESVGILTRTLDLNQRVFNCLRGKPQITPIEFSKAQPLRLGAIDQQSLPVETSKEVEDVFDAALDRAKRRGAEVHSVSLPLHQLGALVHLVVYVHEVAQTMHSRGNTSIDVEVENEICQAMQHWLADDSSIPDELKALLVFDDVLNRQFGKDMLKRARIMLKRLCYQYEMAFQQVDVLVTPTSLQLPPPFPDRADSKLAQLLASMTSTEQTSPFNASGHPAMSVPIGMTSGCPIGAMVVGPYCSEDLLFAAGNYLVSA